MKWGQDSCKGEVGAGQLQGGSGGRTAARGKWGHPGQPVKAVSTDSYVHTLFLVQIVPVSWERSRGNWGCVDDIDIAEVKGSVPNYTNITLNYISLGCKVGRSTSSKSATSNPTMQKQCCSVAYF